MERWKILFRAKPVCIQRSHHQHSTCDSHFYQLFTTRPTSAWKLIYQLCIICLISLDLSFAVKDIPHVHFQPFYCVHSLLYSSVLNMEVLWLRVLWHVVFISVIQLLFFSTSQVTSHFLQGFFTSLNSLTQI